MDKRDDEAALQTMLHAVCTSSDAQCVPQAMDGIKILCLAIREILEEQVHLPWAILFHMCYHRTVVS